MHTLKLFRKSRVTFIDCGVFDGVFTYFMQIFLKDSPVYEGVNLIEARALSRPFGYIYANETSRGWGVHHDTMMHGVK